MHLMSDASLPGCGVLTPHPGGEAANACVVHEAHRMSDQLSCGPLTNMPGILTLAYQVKRCRAR